MHGGERAGAEQQKIFIRLEGLGLLEYARQPPPLFETGARCLIPLLNRPFLLVGMQT